MFDFSWPEMAIVAVVALVVIGPKDLPRVLRTAGTWVRRARAVAREFQGSLEQMVREAELDEVREQLKKTTSFDLSNEIAKTVDPQGELKASLSDAMLTPPLPDPTSPDAGPDDAVLPELALPELAPPETPLPEGPTQDGPSPEPTHPPAPEGSAPAAAAAADWPPTLPGQALRQRRQRQCPRRLHRTTNSKAARCR